ncbi:hypothetical protein [Paenirhodobacter hankyongi]|uniref:hypothetical protein n=1 Tax=Paenirhodobacter hankyongi TaxID=2294033 RepID=UPI0011C39FD1|nr:hypothetical protein [Sinirhodobacter hankyongi]
MCEGKSSIAGMRRLYLEPSGKTAPSGDSYTVSYSTNWKELWEGVFPGSDFSAIRNNAKHYCMALEVYAALIIANAEAENAGGNAAKTLSPSIEKGFIRAFICDAYALYEGVFSAEFKKQNSAERSWRNIASSELFEESYTNKKALIKLNTDVIDPRDSAIHQDYAEQKNINYMALDYDTFCRNHCAVKKLITWARKRPGKQIPSLGNSTLLEDPPTKRSDWFF